MIRRSYLFIIPLTFIVSFLTYLDRGSVSFGSLQFRKDLGLSAADCTSFLLGYHVQILNSMREIHDCHGVRAEVKYIDAIFSSLSFVYVGCGSNEQMLSVADGTGSGIFYVG